MACSLLYRWVIYPMGKKEKLVFFNTWIVKEIGSRIGQRNFWKVKFFFKELGIKHVF